MPEKRIFKAMRQEYGDNIVKFMDKSLPMNSTLRVGFDWGNTGAGARQLATAILKEISNQTIARIYTTKYTNAVVKNLRKDNWTLTALEVEKWINENTEYTVEDEEAIANEKQKALDAEEKRLELIKAKEAKIAKEANERREREIKALQEKEAKELQALKDKEARELQIKKDREARELQIKQELQEKEKLSKQVKSTTPKKKVVYDGDNIVATICKDLNIMQDELAEILGVTVQTVKNWKLEDEMPRLARKAMEFYADDSSGNSEAELEKTIEELKSINLEVADLKSQIKNDKVDISEYKAQIKNYRVDMSEYKEEISDYKATIVEQKEHLRNHKVDIEGYKDDLVNYKAEIEDLKAYREFIDLMNIPALHKRYSNLNGV